MSISERITGREAVSYINFIEDHNKATLREAEVILSDSKGLGFLETAKNKLVDEFPDARVGKPEVIASNVVGVYLIWDYGKSGHDYVWNSVSIAVSTTSRSLIVNGSQAEVLDESRWKEEGLLEESINNALGNPQHEYR